LSCLRIFHRKSGARNLFRGLCPLGLLLLAACGGKDAPPDDRSSTLPVERTKLVLAVEQPTAALRSVGGRWAQREAVELEVVAADSATSASASLIETRGPGESAWLLEPRGLLVRLDALQGIGRSDEPPASWPELNALVIALAREGGGLGLPAETEGLHELLLPLIWSAQADSVALQGASALPADAAEEALAFLVQLSQHALRLPSSEQDEAFLSGEIVLLPCGLEQARRLQDSTPSLRLRLWPWPAAPEAGAARALAILHSLRLPPGAPYADLARSLARELASPDAATEVAASDRASVPASPQASYELTLLPDSTRRALRPWPLTQEEAREAPFLDEACDAALDLRRSPSAAIAELQASLAR